MFLNMVVSVVMPVVVVPDVNFRKFNCRVHSRIHSWVPNWNWVWVRVYDIHPLSHLAKRNNHGHDKDDGSGNDEPTAHQMIVGLTIRFFHVIDSETKQD